MSAIQEIGSLLDELHKASSADGGYEWLDTVLKTAIVKLGELREIALIDIVREAQNKVVPAMFGIPEPEVVVDNATVDELKSESVVDTTPRIVTGYVEPVEASQLVNVTEAFEEAAAPAPAPTKKASKKAAENNNAE